FDSNRIEHRQRVLRNQVDRVAGGRFVRSSIAAVVEGDDAEPLATEVRHLAFPHAAVDDRPRRQEQNCSRGVRRTEYFVEDSRSVCWIGGIPVGMRITRTHGPTPSVVPVARSARRLSRAFATGEPLPPALRANGASPCRTRTTSGSPSALLGQ